MGACVLMNQPGICCAWLDDFDWVFPPYDRDTLAVVHFVDGCGRPVGWLDSDCCVVDEIVLAPEMSPFVSVRSADVPTFLPAMSEVFSLAVFAGGGGGRGRDSHSASVCPAGCWE